VEELLVTAVGYLKLAVEAVGAAIVGFGSRQRSPRFTSLTFEEGRGAAAPALLTLVQEPVGDLVVACLPRPRTRPSVIYVAAAP
jgi:hypothetical protein